MLMVNNHDSLGGITTFVNSLGSALKNEGYDVEMASAEAMHKDAPTLIDDEFNLTIGTTKCMPENRSYKRMLDWLNPIIVYNRSFTNKNRYQAGRKLAKYFNSLGNDTVVIITQVFVAEALKQGGAKLTKRDGPYVVGMYHGSFEQAITSRDFNRVKKYFSDIDKFLVLTELDKELFREHKFNNVDYIYNPVSIMPNSTHHTKKEKKVVSMGRYHPQKSLDYLLRSWSLVCDEFKDWKLELYGGGEDHDMLQGLINELDISDSAFLMGRAKRVDDVLAGASINAMSSQYEGLPIAIVEAARFNVPTVAFNCAPGIEELIKDEVTGYVTPQNNIELLADGLRKLMSDDDRRVRMGDLAQKESLKYTPESIVKKWIKMFDNLEL